MTWKANAYLAAALFVLFVLLNFIPTEDDLALVLATAFIALFLLTVVSVVVTVVRSLWRRWAPFVSPAGGLPEGDSDSPK